ncbi:50S ribosomal protein L24 [Rhodohalobacter sp. SW132]|uniref:50S ribosomal protein L24 n=1 Tax=Rhodohalobacter sp. SW132 TaxID=2293433 RepID=UPI000E2676B9|nr:50S ribosomal protein L24 [Rhodohalobacter sp. SW132]REL23956.1 50S ribosomal protein L24 [Rhodohalobacter sp. SW132]
MPRKFNRKKKLHVKQGDDVLVLAGNDKGKRGRVMLVYPERDRVLVEGVNMRTHHEKPSQENPQGGRLKREAPVHISNLMVIDPTTDEPTRIGRKRIEEEGGGRWVRYAKSSGEIIDK